MLIDTIMDKPFRAIRFIEKEVIESNISSGRVSATKKAKTNIANAPNGSVLALRVSINSPVSIEDARVLSPQGLRELAEVKEE
jgi:hypothetical protein